MTSKNTTVSLDDALRLFSSWKEQSLTVRVSFSGGAKLPDNPSTIRVGVEGNLIGVSMPGLPGVVSVQGKDCNIEVDLRGSRLTLSDPQDTSFGGDAFASQFGVALEAWLTNGEYCLFLAFRRAN